MQNLSKYLTIWLAMCAVFLGGLSVSAFSQAAEEPLAAFTESNTLTTELKQKIVSLYEEALRLQLHDGKPDAETTQEIQSRIDGNARCIMQRVVLVDGQTDEQAQEELIEDMLLFADHYSYFAFALERHSLVKASTLINSLQVGAGTLRKEIVAIYEVSAKSESNQMSDDAYNLYKGCEALLKDAKNIERQAQKKVGK